MKFKEIRKKANKLLAALFVCFGIVLIILSFFYNSNNEINKVVAAKELNHRAAYHFTTPDKWKNDPQRPVFFDGEYHYYYLYNKDYPNGNGTEWRHATSEDLVHWKDEGVAIPKYTNKNGDIWSGSVVVDTQNTSGFGKDAIVSIVTQPSENSGQQEQFLWYSTDKGRSFKSYSDQPILSNPGTKDFRDPKIIWDSQNNKWVMILAEGTKIGFYESYNLKSWKYTGAFFTNNIGIVECPDLFIMQSNDGTYKWVLGVSGNGKSSGKPNTYAYWIGNYNGKEFIADQSEEQWLDYGFDWYAGVTFESGNSNDKLTKRYALAWMNNWDYSNNTPTVQEDFNGMDSIVREIKLKKQVNNTYSLISQPVETLDSLITSTEYLKKMEVSGSKELQVQGEAYQLDADISWIDAKNLGISLRESDDKKHHVDVGIFTEGQYSYVNRKFTQQPDQSQKYFENIAPFDTSKKNVHLKILVDKTSIEVFVDDGNITYSNEVFPNSNDKGIELFSIGGKAIFQNIVIKHFSAIN
ncbi:glycoside hydrolase family 32 protein [Clostridium saccharobutylicum]|uniref:Levanbiose-producing levanase n=1 Tax=Clostridium saccharobutylicum TaxID=169679 RepID=A0A1S8MP03_CLOSA|nr:glycoside hydrolase family 32 protein [Clostridium saccharobutylicum]OOM05916.1 levanbiose-producing levanase [Clostridium saccharobutylicum]